MKKITQLFAFQLIILTLFGVVACSKGDGQDNAALTDARKAELDQQLNSLAVDVDIEKFHQLFGEPASQKPHEVTIVTTTIKRHARPRREEETFAYTEYLYENNYFYVQAVTDEAGKVGMYSITAKPGSYQPVLRTSLEKPLQLGKTVYADFSPIARKIAADFRPNPAKPAYYEVVVGESDEAPYAVVSTNPQGSADQVGRLAKEDGDVLVKWFSLRGDDFPMNEMHEAFRKATVINTYTRVASWFRGVDNSSEGSNFDETAIYLGPRESGVSNR